MRVVIISGGIPPSKEILERYLKQNDYIIGVDKGLETIYKYKIKYDLAIGDFDSISSETLEKVKSSGVDYEKYNAEKDYSDTHLAYLIARDMKAKEILIFGGTGSRIDHMLGNLGLFINSLSDNIHLEIIDDNNRMFVINKPSYIKGQYGQLISFHALSDKVKNLSIYGGKYSLENYDMLLLEPRAICNEFLHEDIHINFSEGIILVNFPKD